jgi:toxin CcdB
MAQFDVYRNPRRGSVAPLLLDVQHRLFSDLKTRVVVPLVPAKGVVPMTRLNPVIDIAGKKLIMSTTELAGIATKDIGERVGNVAHERATIMAALDYVFTGV